MSLEADLLKEYLQGKTLREVGEKYNVSATTVLRAVKKAGKLRDKSEAQKKALAEGRSLHPTQGKQRKESTKEKISNKVSASWDKLSKEEYESRQKEAKERWKNIDPTKKDLMLKKASKAIRKSSEEGSKMEHFLRGFLEKNGYQVVFHKKELIPNLKLEVDLLIPNLRTAIEIDGRSHFEPIWGLESFERTKKSDMEKNALLVSYGFRVIRVKYDADSFSLKSKNSISRQILALLKRIENNEIAAEIIKIEE